MADIKYVISADATGAVKGIKQVDGAVDNLQRTTGKATPKWVGFAKQVAIGGAAAIAARAAIRGLVKWMGDAVKAASAQEQVERQLNQVLESTGYAAGLSATELKKFAEELQKSTTYGDEAIIGAENLLLTFTKIGKEVFPDALETVLDMSTALGQDLKSSSIQLGKALNDPILGMTALRRVGVNFNTQQAEMVKGLVESGRHLEAQKFILQELQTEFGGAARAAADTFGGKIAKLENVTGDLNEQFGTAITESETFRGVLDNLTRIIANLVESDVIPKLGQQIEQLFKHGYLWKRLINNLEIIATLTEGMAAKERKAEEQAKAYAYALGQVDVGLQKIGVDLSKFVPWWERKEAAVHEANEVLDQQVTLLDTWIPKAVRAAGVLEQWAKITDTEAIPAVREMSGVLNQAVGELETHTYETLEATRSFWDEFSDGLQTKWASTIGEVLRGASSLKDGLKGIWDAIVVQFTDMIGQMIAKWVTKFIGKLVESTADAAGSVVGSVADMGKAAMNLAQGFNPGGMIATAVGTAVGTFLGGLIGGSGPSARSTDLIKDNTWETAQHTRNTVLNLDQMKWEMWSNITPNLNDMKLTLWSIYEMFKGGGGGVVSGGPSSISFNPTMSLKIKAAPLTIHNYIQIDGKTFLLQTRKELLRLSKRGHLRFHENGLVTG